MMIKKSKNYNENYAFKVVKLSNPIKHGNADKLIGWSIDGNIVWTNKETKENDIVFYFPVNSKIDSEILSKLNLYRDKTLNADNEKVGFFEENGRVSALKLRGEPSEGVVLPAKEIYNILGEETDNYEIGKYGDMLFNKVLVTKYIPKSANPKGEQTIKSGQRSKKKQKNRIIDNQWNFHYSTGHFGKNLWKFNDDDVITVTKKLHGTSAVFANIPVKRVLSRFERFLQWIGISIAKTEFQPVVSSRKVIKGIGDNSLMKDSPDVWKYAYSTKMLGIIPKGVTIYAEIVGYHPNSNKFIQQNYDYGCIEGNFEIYVYRITTTNDSGNVYEWNWGSVKEFCYRHNLKHVPELHYGTANLLFDDENDILSDVLKKKFIGGKETMCLNDVWAEGICIREETNKIWYKLKSFDFVTNVDGLDIPDIETIESEGA